MLPQVDSEGITAPSPNDPNHLKGNPSQQILENSSDPETVTQIDDRPALVSAALTLFRKADLVSGRRAEPCLHAKRGSSFPGLFTLK
jgi:hypothetical protein